MTESTAPARTSALTLPRILGAIGMVTSPFLFLGFAYDGFRQGESSHFAAILGLVFTFGWFSNAVGLASLGVAGRRLPAKILLGIEIVGTILAALCQVYDFAIPTRGLLYAITDIAWPLSIMTVLIIGIIAIFARHFEGWLRFTPFVAALWLPLGMLELPLLGEKVGLTVGSVHNALGWFLIGYAVFRSDRLTARD